MECVSLLNLLENPEGKAERWGGPWAAPWEAAASSQQKHPLSNPFLRKVTRWLFFSFKVTGYSSRGTHMHGVSRGAQLTGEAQRESAWGSWAEMRSSFRSCPFPYRNWLLGISGQRQATLRGGWLRVSEGRHYRARMSNLSAAQAPWRLLWSVFWLNMEN